MSYSLDFRLPAAHGLSQRRLPELADVQLGAAVAVAERHAPRRDRALDVAVRVRLLVHALVRGVGLGRLPELALALGLALAGVIAVARDLRRADRVVVLAQLRVSDLAWSPSIYSVWRLA